MVSPQLPTRLTSFWTKAGVNQRIYELLDKTDIDDVTQLAKAGAQIRQWIIDTPFQPELENAIREAYAQLSADDENACFAVRSSATAEDMPDASFAGQQETFSTFRVLTLFSWQ